MLSSVRIIQVLPSKLLPTDGREDYVKLYTNPDRIHLYSLMERHEIAIGVLGNINVYQYYHVSLDRGLQALLRI